ncbi:hypothetical protein [Nocardioides antri]|uniref:DUF4878 domain-containing protein n=1 Tax=Nocardioides antri TaxID=2607659 RepID=A0A5B1MAG2_9ACTN|nr:hypothetical protein [Nocardioides antri]KAA1429426.1 hypothetical protein F0U47_04375 [Nocardioides antri]
MKSGLLAALLVPLLLTGCGDDDKDSSADDETAATAGLSPDEAAVHEALVKSLLDPDCDLLTEEYLLEMSVLGAETPEEACEERQNLWQEPQYDEDDILVSDIVVDGDVATAVIGSEYVNITTTYELQRVDGEWKVSCDDFTCDRLDEPSAEVS